MNARVFHPRPITQNPRHRQLGVVVQDRAWDSAEVGEGVVVSFQKGFCRLGRKRHYKAVIGLRQIHCQIVGFALHTADDHHRFAEVGLRVSRRMLQRHEHLALAQLP